MRELRQDAGEAGQIIKTAREEVEKRLGEPVVTRKLPNIKDDGIKELSNTGPQQ